MPVGVEADTYRMEYRALLLPDEQQRDIMVEVTGRVKIVIDGVEVLSDWPDDTSEAAHANTGLRYQNSLT